MTDDESQPDIAQWIDLHWSPSPGDTGMFVARVVARRARLRRRNNALGGAALAASLVLFLASGSSSSGAAGWLSSTSLAEPIPSMLSTDLVVLQQTFRVGVP
jgi:hypothetical protein